MPRRTQFPSGMKRETPHMFRQAFKTLVCPQRLYYQVRMKASVLEDHEVCEMKPKAIKDRIIVKTDKRTANEGAHIRITGANAPFRSTHHATGAIGSDGFDRLCSHRGAILSTKPLFFDFAALRDPRTAHITLNQGCWKTSRLKALRTADT